MRIALVNEKGISNEIVETIVQNYNVEIAANSDHCVSFLSSGKVDFSGVSLPAGTDVFELPEKLELRLALFDMQECIDELADLMNIKDQVARITEEAMNGLIDFNESLARRLLLLKDAPVSIIESVRQRIVFTPGAKELCKALQKSGCKLAVVSAEYVQKELGLDHAFANSLAMKDGKLLGATIGPVVNATRKKEIMSELASLYGLDKDSILAVGDGANDIPMLTSAGIGVAFNAKRKVQEQVQYRLNQTSLSHLIPVLGLKQE